MKYSDNQPKHKKGKAKQVKTKAKTEPKFDGDESPKDGGYSLFGQTYNQDEDTQLFAYSDR
jgi:hypothetical protein